MFGNLRTQFAIQREIAKVDKMAKNEITVSMAIIASKLEREAKGNINELAIKPLEQLAYKHTEIVRKYVVQSGHPAITFYKAQLDSVLISAVSENDIDIQEIQDETNDNIIKKLVNLKLLPARFLDLEDQL